MLNERTEVRNNFLRIGAATFLAISTGLFFPDNESEDNGVVCYRERGTYLRDNGETFVDAQRRCYPPGMVPRIFCEPVARESKKILWLKIPGKEATGALIHCNAITERTK